MLASEDDSKRIAIATACQLSYGKVMFSVVSVCPQDRSHVTTTWICSNLFTRNLPLPPNQPQPQPQPCSPTHMRTRDPLAPAPPTAMGTSPYRDPPAHMRTSPYRHHGPHCRDSCLPCLYMFILVHYGARIVGKRVVDIRLKRALVIWRFEACPVTYSGVWISLFQAGGRFR